MVMKKLTVESEKQNKVKKKCDMVPLNEPDS